jgi:hypothetical protein
MMKRLSFTILSLLITGMLSGCVVAHDRYGRGVVVEPEFWGTVTYVDPRSHRIDLDYVDGGGRHMARQVYYDEQATRWDGVRYSELHSGDQLVVRGRNVRGRYRVESVHRH